MLTNRSDGNVGAGLHTVVWSEGALGAMAAAIFDPAVRKDNIIPH